MEWSFSQVKGSLDDEISEGESIYCFVYLLTHLWLSFLFLVPCHHSQHPLRLTADIISCVEFSHEGNLLATGDKGGRVVIFQREDCAKKTSTGGGHGRKGEYSVYTTFQSHEPEFDYLKSLEIEEKINKIRWLKRKNAA